MLNHLNFDSHLLEEAKKLGGFKYKKDAIHAALTEYVNRHKQLQIISLFDSINSNPD